VFLRFQEEKTFWQKIPSRVGNQQLSIHIKRLLDYLKSSDIFCPRKFQNSSPEKISPEKIAHFLVSKISPATGVIDLIAKNRKID